MSNTHAHKHNKRRYNKLYNKNCSYTHTSKIPTANQRQTDRCHPIRCLCCCIFERYGLSSVLPPKLLLLCRILVVTLFSCTIRELWPYVIFPHVKFITPPYQNIFPFHNLVCYDYCYSLVLIPH